MSAAMFVLWGQILAILAVMGAALVMLLLAIRLYSLPRARLRNYSDDQVARDPALERLTHHPSRGPEEEDDEHA